MSLPSKADLFLYQGDTYSAEVTLIGASAPDLAEYTGLAQIRKSFADEADEVVATFLGTVTGPKTFLMSLTPEETTALSGDYRWDLQLTSGDGVVTTVLAGKMRVDPEVSRA